MTAIKVKIYKNEVGGWIREEMIGWVIKAAAFRTRKEARTARLNEPVVEVSSFPRRRMVA